MTQLTPAQLAILRPDERDITPNWDERTSDNQKACHRLFMDMMKYLQMHFVIDIQYRQDIPGHTSRERTGYPVHTIPLQFSSYAQAEVFLALAPMATEWPIEAHGYRSASIRCVHHEKRIVVKPPQVRKADLIKRPKSRTRGTSHG